MGNIQLKKLINQKGYEKIERVMRRDKIILIADLLFYFILFLVPIALYYIFQSYLQNILTHNIWRPVLVMITSIYYFSTWIFFFSAFLDYYLDTWIITNERLLNVEQEGVFSRIMAELDLYKIQDATSDNSGIFPYLFGYGNVHIQTAGEQKKFELEQVPTPHEIRKLIMDLAEEARKFHKNGT